MPGASSAGYSLCQCSLILAYGDGYRLTGGMGSANALGSAAANQNLPRTPENRIPLPVRCRLVPYRPIA